MSTPAVVAAPTPIHYTPLKDRASILAALLAFVQRRPGLKRAYFETNTEYWKAQREISRDLHDAETLIRYVQGSIAITPHDLTDAFETAYSGRLKLHHVDGGIHVDYKVNQSFPMEFRRAVCAGLALAIRRDFRKVPEQRHQDESQFRKEMSRLFRSDKFVTRWF